VPDDQICLVVAGSQGQAGSSLVRAVSGEHRLVNIHRGDKVIVASEPIPGNEINVYGVIDELAEKGIDVAYSDVDDDLHVSGHAGEYEQMLMVHLLKPKYLFPIGGEERHRVRFSHVVEHHGYNLNQIVLPHYGKPVELDANGFRYGKEIKLRERTITVAGTTSQVMDQVLADREILGKQGVIVVAMNEVAGNYDLSNMSVEERGLGLTSPEEQEQLYQIVRETVRETLAKNGQEAKDLPIQIKNDIRYRIRQESEKEPLVLVIINSIEGNV